MRREVIKRCSRRMIFSSTFAGYGIRCIVLAVVFAFPALTIDGVLRGTTGQGSGLCGLELVSEQRKMVIYMCLFFLTKSAAAPPPPDCRHSDDERCFELFTR